ncbi:MAG: hypothetical protein ACE5J3_01345 [Methanosarcinales archaeon]
MITPKLVGVNKNSAVPVSSVRIDAFKALLLPAMKKVLSLKDLYPFLVDFLVIFINSR